MKSFTKKTLAALASTLLCASAMSYGGNLTASENAKTNGNTVTTCPTITITLKTTNVTCSGDNNGLVVATAAGGASPYTYSWTTGSTSDSAKNLVAGTYTVTATDINGCTGTQTVTVTQPTPLRDSISTQTNVACFGGTTGSARVGVKGGTSTFGTYTYSWNTTPVQTGRTANGLGAGTYTVYVTDKNGCKDSAIVVITQPATAVSAKIVDSTQVACFGSKTGSAVVNATGGTPGYTYTWAASGGTKDTASNLGKGTYTVTVTDKNGCKTTVSTTITQPASALTATASSTTPASCGQSNGAAYATVAGGTSPYNFVWTPAGGTNDTAKGIAAGAYTVTVTDAGGCSVTATTTVANNSTLAVTATSTIITPCFGGNNGTGTANTTGGTPAYTYSWSTGVTTSTISNLVAGIYTVTVTDASGCIVSTTDTIKQPALVKDTITPTNISCNGGNNGSAIDVTSGGTTPYTYAWSNGQTASTATNLSTGTYTLTATDANGCTASKTFAVTQPTTIRDSVIATTPITCYGNTNGRVTIGVAGGTPGYTYSWAPGGSTRTRVTGGAGTYTVTITDKNGCTKIDSVTMTQPPLLIAKIVDSTQVACFGSKTGSAVVTASGGTPSYTYAWAASGGSKDTASALGAATYTVTVTDGNGCKATISTTITQPATALTATVKIYGASCGKSNGSAKVTATGGTPGYTYNWTPAGGTTDTASGLGAGIYACTITDANGCTYAASANVTDSSTLAAKLDSSFNVTPCFGDHNGRAYFHPSGGTPGYTYSWAPSGGTDSLATNLSAGTYTFTVTDSKLCIVSSTITITRPTLVVATIGTPTNVTCNGGTNGSANVKATGGTGAYTYSWAPSGSTTTNATGLGAGTYTVTVTDANGCTAVDSVTVTQPAAITDTISSTNVSCFGSNNGSASVTVSGGTPAYRYTWAPGGNTTTSVSNLAPGTYTVSIRDANFCTATANVTITQPAQLRDSMASSANVLCFAANTGSATVGLKGGTTPYTFSWTPSGGTNATASNLTAGGYTINITDANGCTGSANVTITQPASPLADSAKSIAASCAKNNGSAEVFAYGGTGSYTYSWNSGASTSAINTVIAGTYTCSVMDGNGCTVTPLVIVADSTTLTASITPHVNDMCNGVCDGSANGSATGGTTPYTYSWTGGQTNANATSLCAGKYNFMVTDNKGCTASDTVTISQPSPLTVTIDSSITGGCTNSAWAVVSGGTKPYTYSWSPGGQTTDTASALCNGSYMVSVTDANSCNISGNIIIAAPAGIVEIQAPSALKVYPNPTTGNLNIHVSGNSFMPQAIMIYDMTGRKLVDQKVSLNNNIITIDVSKLEQGAYILRLVSNDNQKLEKFTIIK